MTDPTTAPPAIDDLLAHASWVRRLATTLVHDAAQAEDLAQEVFVTALRRQPAHLDHPRAWLAAVARRLAITRGRTESRRALREQAAPERGPAPPTDDLVAEAERGRELAKLVLSLAEPYRTVVLMRYWRDRPPRRIARELGRPVETVKVQLRRGVEHLRATLDAQHGDRDSWAVMLLPLAVPRTAAALPTGLVAAAAVGAVGGALWLGTALWKGDEPAGSSLVQAAAPGTETGGPRRGIPQASSPLAGENSDPGEQPPGRRPAQQVPPQEEERTVLETRRETSGWVAPMPLFPKVDGRLRGLDGKPLRGVALGVRPEQRLHWSERGDALVRGNRSIPVDHERRLELLTSSEVREDFLADAFMDTNDARNLQLNVRLREKLATTDKLGRFEMRAGSPGDVICVSDEYRIVGWAPTGEAAPAPAIDFFATEDVYVLGKVVDEAGLPWDELEIEVAGVCPPQLSRLLPTGTGLSWTTRRITTSLKGTFRAHLPRIALLLQATVEPRRRLRVLESSAPQERTEPLEVLRGSATARLDLARAERPVQVVLSYPRRRTERRLRFSGVVRRSDGTPAAEARVLFAGVTATVDETGLFELEAQQVAPDDALGVFEPGQPPLLLEGYGRRVARLADPASTGDLVLPAVSLSLEGVVLGSSGQPAPERRYWLEDPTELLSLDDGLEAYAAGTEHRWLYTGPDGRFALPGLLPRDYRIRVERADGTEQSFGPFPAGTWNLALVLSE